MSPLSEDQPHFVAGGRGFALLVLTATCLVAAGAAAFVHSVLAGDKQRGWQIFLSNYVFWTGLSFGSAFLLSIMNLTSGRWIRPFKRLVEGPATFAPLCWLLFWPLYWGRESLLPWIAHPDPKKALYLNVDFFFAREGAGIFLLALAAMALVYFSVTADRKVLPGNRREAARQDQKLWKAQIACSIVFAGLYVLLLTLFSWDLVMSLSPEWVSTLFGPYFFTGCLYSAIAALAVSAALAFYGSPLRHHVTPHNFYSLGLTLFGFLMVFGDFFFSQFLLIWYGNKPEETRFLIQRFRFEPWRGLSIAAGVLTIGLPFVVLLSRKIKHRPPALGLVALVIFIGMWLERYILVVPSLWRRQGLPLGWMEALVSLGFLGLMALSVLIFLRRHPLLPLSDPLLQQGAEGGRTGAMKTHAS